MLLTACPKYLLQCCVFCLCKVTYITISRYLALVCCVMFTVCCWSNWGYWHTTVSQSTDSPGPGSAVPVPCGMWCTPCSSRSFTLSVPHVLHVTQGHSHFVWLPRSKWTVVGWPLLGVLCTLRVFYGNIRQLALHHTLSKSRHQVLGIFRWNMIKYIKYLLNMILKKSVYG